MKIKYHAPYRDPSGYGMAARNYILELDKLGVDVHAVPQGFWKGSFEMSDEINAKLSKLEDKETDGTVPLISQQTPTHFNVDYPGYKIGYTVHETTKIIPLWADYINRMDEVWTSSQFAIDVFERSGVTIPKYKIPHGVDRKVFNTKVKPLDLVNVPSESFVFLSVFQWIYRKGFDVLLKAYYQTFESDENVALIIKTFGYQEGLTEARRIHKEIMSIQAEVGLENAPPVYLLFDFFKYGKMARLYNSADAFVLPSRGEAWGIPYLEAMSCGLPVLGTRWSGQLEFLNDDNSLLIDLDEESVVRGMHVPWFTSDQRWAEPCLRSLRNGMRTIYEDTTMQKLLRKQSIKTAKKWPWSKGAKLMKVRLESLE